MGCCGFSDIENTDRDKEVGMRRILYIVTAVLLVLVLGFAVAACRKSSGDNGGGGGYLPAPTSTVPAASA